MPDNNLFQDIQQSVKDRLETSDSFTGIPIFTEELGDPVSMMEAKLAKTGLAVYVATPSMEAESKDMPGPYFTTIRVMVMIWELVPVNRSESGTNITSGGLVLCAANLLHLYTPTGLGEFSIATDKPCIVSAMDAESNVISQTLHLDTHGGLTTA